MPGGQYINHFNAVRMNVKGSGSLQSKLVSLDATTEYSIPNVTLQTEISRYPNQLVNFSQQKAQIELKTTAINEVFTLRQILVYTKPVSTSYPQ